MKFNVNSVESQSEKQKFDTFPEQTLFLKEMHYAPCFTQFPTYWTFGMQVDCTVQPAGHTDVKTWNPAVTCQDRMVSPGQPRNYSTLNGKCFPADNKASARNEELKNKVTDRTCTKRNGCPTAVFPKSPPATHSLKLLLSAVLRAPATLIQNPINDGYDMVRMTDLADPISKHKDTRKGGVAKKRRHYFARAGLEQGKFSSSGLPASWSSFSQHLYPLTDTRAKI